MDTEEIDAGDLEEGDLVVIDGEPCVVSDLDRSTAGKHGTSKVTITAAGLESGEERSLTQPADGAVEVPAVETQNNPLILVGGDGGHFDPAIVAVPTGGSAVWLWDDDDPHRVVADDGSFESDAESGEGFTFERVFEDPGTLTYRCAEHDATGVVIVEAE